MNETLKMIMELMECTEQDAKTILNNMLNKNIVKNAIKIAIKKDFELE